MIDPEDRTIERWGAEAHAQGVPRDSALIAGKWLVHWHRGWDKAQALRIAETMGRNDRKAGITYQVPPVGLETEGEQEAWQRGWRAEDQRLTEEKAGPTASKDTPMSAILARAHEPRPDLFPSVRLLVEAARAVWCCMDAGLMIDDADFLRLDERLRWFEVDGDCSHPRPVDMSLGDGTPVRFCSDCGVNFEVGGRPVRSAPAYLGPHGDEEPEPVCGAAMTTGWMRACERAAGHTGPCAATPETGIVSLRPAPSNLRPVSSGPLMHPDVVEGLIAAAGLAPEDDPLSGLGLAAIPIFVALQAVEDSRALLRQCYRSGQMTEAQWIEHCRDDPGLDPEPVAAGGCAPPIIASVVRPVHGGYPGEAVAVKPAPWSVNGVEDLAEFRIRTPDPRFDPDKPVTVNGFLYHPASRPSGGSN